MMMNTVTKKTACGITYTTPALGMDVTTQHGDFGTIFEVVPRVRKDGVTVYNCRIGKANRPDRMRWATFTWLLDFGTHYRAI